MQMIRSWKHIAHVLCLLSLITILQVGVWSQQGLAPATIEPQLGPVHNQDLYSRISKLLLHLIKFSVLLPLPQMVFNFLGLTCFEAFPDDDAIIIKSNQSNNDNEADKNKTKPLEQLELTHFCVRVVTRGNFPELVQNNVTKNYFTCIEAGLNNFSIEVVTDKQFPLTDNNPRIRQIVVPTGYQTSTGALYKARALQYALEPLVSPVKEGDYIIHLDEETIITQGALRGIINFILDGKHQFGQGLITYAKIEVVNWFTTLADSIRVGDDMGKLRFQFYAFHKPLFGWKGSYVVTRYEAERDVSWDHGPDGSIAEDCCFAMIALTKGYSFNFIEGEMLEKSPFTISDLIQQRKRWIQGIWLVVHSSRIPLKSKFLLALSAYAWISLPLIIIGCLLSLRYPQPSVLYLDSFGSFGLAITIHMYLFGLMKSFELKRIGYPMYAVYLFIQLCSILISAVTEYIAVVWGLLGKKNGFFIVDKKIAKKPEVVAIEAA